ncbi:predicted protein [Sclerotinia sclerotiorum 1980 UF-70]|uniref:Uncharacterized protein n=1 Tax=Sclerotinia sclerotiorum (strain ATCC 18683 / 1980 / Ss-1) TaxID=665079 RepID=A7E7Z1_SCLS1|nr:predicted protein [Sclerotinia sclerotiorum 1980 UF-70]EDN96493.1 predicted protein [Sclerotinia sclerotiorum 1980 UF-70]
MGDDVANKLSSIKLLLPEASTLDNKQIGLYVAFRSTNHQISSLNSSFGHPLAEKACARLGLAIII